MVKYLFISSLILNGLFIIMFTYLVLKYREYLIQKFIGKKKAAKIVLFGDSLIDNGNWNELLKRTDIKNSGFGGTTTSHLTRLIDNNVLAYHPEICFLEGGINDIEVGIPLDRIMSNYQSLIDTLLSHNITTVVHSVIYQENKPQNKIIIDQLNSFLSNYCKQKSVRYLNINSKLSTDTGLKPEYSTDGTHLTDSAYFVWGEEIRKELKSIKRQ